MKPAEMILYRDFKHEDILDNMTYLYHKDTDSEVITEEDRSLAYSVAGSLTSLSENHGYGGNLWHTYLTYLIANNENAFSMACEIRGRVSGSINEVALHDFTVFKELFEWDIESLDA